METVDQIRLKLETIMKEENPSIDLSPGSVLSELLTKLTAAAQYDIRNQINTIAQASTVKAVLDAADDTYEPVVDNLASNYDTYRNQGQKATGKIKVFVRESKRYFVPDGLIFQQPNLLFNYLTTASYTASTSPIGNDIELKKQNELYYFIVDVEAEQVGVDNNVANGTKFALSNTTSLPEFVDAEAYGTFSSGQTQETDKELISRFKTGLSVKNLVSPYAIESVLKDQYSGFKAVSVVGSGDVELKRNTNNLFGINIPGKADVYVRTSNVINTVAVQLTGTKQVGGEYDGKWKITVGKDEFPGFYRVASIIQSQGDYLGTQSFVKVIYGLDLTGEDRTNDITNAKDARFTKYQTAEVYFEYPSANSTELFDVTLTGMPDIDSIQDLFINDSKRIVCADYLVKAVAPCSVSVYLKVVRKSATDVIDVESIKKDIFSYINNIPFGESLDISTLIDICHNYNIKRVDLPVIVRGIILPPYSDTAETINVSGTDNIEIPYLPEKGVTKNTTAFFTSYFDATGSESIGVEVV